MINTFINIGDFNYYIEFDNSQDYALTHRAKYVMLRKFNLINNVVCDTNLYFIEYSLFLKLKEQIKNKESIDCICFPGGGNQYSNSYTVFNDLFTDDDLISESMVYKLYNVDSISNADSTDEILMKDIKQNRVKIYHPSVKISNKFIVHIENVINNIHVHYICNLYDNFEVYSENEIRLQNNIYSEYIEVEIPDIRDLFGMIIDGDSVKYTTYYKEDLNTVETTSEANKIFIEEILKTTNEQANNEYKIIIQDEDANETQFLPLALLTQPYQLIKDENNEYKKKYYKHNLSVSNNYMTAPLNIILYPYDYIDKTNNLYILDSDLFVGSALLNYEYLFKLASKCDFDSEGIIAFLTQIIYPKAIISNISEQTPEQEKAFIGLKDAYCYYNGITNTDIYDTAYNELYENYKEELEDISHITSIPEYDLNVMYGLDKKYKDMTKPELLEAYKNLKMQSFLEEYIEEYKTNIDFFGFRIEIGTDINFTNIIFAQNQSLSINFLKAQSAEELKNMSFVDCLNNYVFTFNMNHLFSDWLQVPETLIAKIYFIDRFTGFVIESNPVVVHKEKFKYIINDNKYYRSKGITDKNNILTIFKDNMTEYNLSDSSFNFINNVKCIIHDDTEQNNAIISDIKHILADSTYQTDTDKVNAINAILSNKNYLPKNTKVTQTGNVIYKPIFFSTHTLDNIILKSNTVQNIGIDLHEYVSVVDVFTLYLDDKKYTEIGRTNNYVMFNINAMKITGIGGEYKLFNSDNEYIASGYWSIS